MTGCVRRRGRLGRGLETLSASNGYATAVFVHRTIEVAPLPFDTNVGFP
jgi:hypothetical protein